MIGFLQILGCVGDLGFTFILGVVAIVVHYFPPTLSLARALASLWVLPQAVSA